MSDEVVGIHLHDLKINGRGDWECKRCKRTAIMLESIPHSPDCKALIKSPTQDPQQEEGV